MPKSRFENVRNMVLDTIYPSERKGTLYDERTGWVVQQVDVREQTLFVGARSIARGLELDGRGPGPERLDDVTAAVFTTDASIEPPVTRVLIPTPFGGYAGMVHGGTEQLIEHENLALHKADSAYGRAILAVMESQLASIPAPANN